VEREPYTGGANWKDSLRGISPEKPVWERSTASSRARQEETAGRRKSSDVWDEYSPKTSKSKSASRRTRSQSDSPDRILSSDPAQSPTRSRTSSVSIPRGQSGSISPTPDTQESTFSQSDIQETQFVGGTTVRGPVGEGGNPLGNYVPFEQFRATRSSSGQDLVSSSAGNKQSSNSGDHQSQYSFSNLESSSPFSSLKSSSNTESVQYSSYSKTSSPISSLSQFNFSSKTYSNTLPSAKSSNSEGSSWLGSQYSDSSPDSTYGSLDPSRAASTSPKSSIGSTSSHAVSPISSLTARGSQGSLRIGLSALK